MNLYPHQARIIDSNPKKALLDWEMRTGKSLPASIWGERRKENCIIVCKKQDLLHWKNLAPYAHVYSKEQFKTVWKGMIKPKALIIDEAHTFGAALFTRRRSALATSMYQFVKLNPDMDVLLLTATPIRNDPSSLHTLLCYIGIYIDWKVWRNEFYSLESRPFLRFPAWLPKPDWRIQIRKYLEKYADIVAFRECVDVLPPATTEIIKVKTPPFVYNVNESPRWTDIHQHEQTNKAQYIKDLGYKKIIIACHYTYQIDELAKELGKDREVFVLDGRTKDQPGTIRKAQESPECYFIVQASMGTGFDGYMFAALVFASMSHTALDHTQMVGRLRSLQDLHPVMYYYLIGGKWDRRIYNSIMENKNFNPHIYKYEDDTSESTTD